MQNDNTNAETLSPLMNRKPSDDPNEILQNCIDNKKICKISKDTFDIVEIYDSIENFDSGRDKRERENVSRCLRHKKGFFKGFFYVYFDESHDFIERLKENNWNKCSVCSEDEKYHIKHDHSNDRTVIDDIKKLFYDNDEDLNVLTGKFLQVHYKRYDRGLRASSTSLIKLSSIADELGVLDEYMIFKNTSIITSRCRTQGIELNLWTDDKKNEITEYIISKYNSIPAWAVLLADSNVPSTYLNHVSLTDLRKEHNLPVNLCLISIDGQVWESQAETCFANFLILRGVEIHKGRPYEEEYKIKYGNGGGTYDGHFYSDLKNMEITVEIWGDRPNGHKEIQYAKKRKNKEDYNKNNPGFLGIHYQDCYVDEKLKHLLEPFLKNLEIKRSICKKDYYDKIESTKLSMLEFVLDVCEEIISENGCFPPYDFLRKHGLYKDRETQSWEKKCGHQKIIHYIDKCGGINKIKEIIGIEKCNNKQNYQNLTRKYLKDGVCLEKISKDEAVEQLKTFYQLHQTTPAIKKRELLKKENRNDEDNEIVKLCTRLLNYIFLKFENSHDAYILAGIPLKKKIPKSKFTILEKKQRRKIN